MGLLKNFFSNLSSDDAESQLGNYDKMLTEVAEFDNGFTFTNSGHERALIANRHLISSAKKEIHIFTPIKEFFHDGVYSKMSEWVPENVQVNILSPTDVTHILLLHGKPPENVNIVQAPQVFLDAVRKRFKCINHFIVVDGKAYRREYDADRHVYIMSFNDPSKAGELIDLFKLRPLEKLKDKATFWDRIGF